MPTSSNSKPPSQRGDLVHEKFIATWAKRFLAVRQEKGKDYAVAWANRFLNEDDTERIAEYLRNMK